MDNFRESLKVELGNKEEVIPVEPNTAEDIEKLYKLHKKERNKRVWKKFSKEYEEEER